MNEQKPMNFSTVIAVHDAKQLCTQGLPHQTLIVCNPPTQRFPSSRIPTTEGSLAFLRTGDGVITTAGGEILSSVHISVDLLQQRMKRGIFRIFDFLDQLRMLRHKLTQVGQFL